MDSTHRRIELQAPADLTYLVSNAKRAARSKLDLHFPPSAAPAAGEDDAMRRRVEQLVELYIQNTFAGVRQSISVNGLDQRELERAVGEGGGGEELEPFDHRLAGRIQDLSGQIEALTLQLANLRRAAPASAAESYRMRFQQDSDAWKSGLRAAEEERMSQATQVELQVAGLERCEDMSRIWDRGTQTLVGVKNGMGVTVARMERAQGVVEYLAAS